ncbi:choice-of-anchor tandem repeat GloVer-containing protein [Flammeovirga pacifica]|uniref:Uncharacterized protein n=1 Tax=Flammeovirga pacifica TaxID=915059 RepID=A0A1S1YYT7_FLAPC|nr:choice-of-anchor tandem repeat GloVer-containing protein [Flammeovirga pacifica]OHX66167.1 hypothetical protein NH26_07285 [Flammeovirga pacifica]
MNTNSEGGIQNAGGISIYNLSSPAGTAPEFYDHGESFTGQPGDDSGLFKATDGFIYGHTEGGGENNSGIFFRIDPSNNTVHQLFSFDYNQHYPVYNLVEHNQILYGIMRNKSISEDIVFAVKLSDPTHLIALSNLKNKYKIKRMGGGFYKLNNKLYAPIFDGLDGSSISTGGILEYDLTSADDKILCSNPFGLMLASGSLSHRNIGGNDRLVVANSGSQYGYGGFYEVDINSGVVRIISIVKDRSFLGEKFSGVFRNSSGTFYSRSFLGGSNQLGTLVSVDPDAKTVSKEYTLGSRNGVANTELLVHGRDLIGMTQPALFTENNFKGVIYKLSNSGQYSELVEFNDFNYPCEYFIITDDDGGTLWGISQFGGNSNQGTIFKFNLTTNKMQVIASFGSDTGFVPESRLALFENGKYTFSNRDGGIANYGTLATFDPNNGAIGHLYSTGNNSLAYQGYSNGAFKASNGKFYAIERTKATSYDVADTLFYRDRLIEFNDDLDSVSILSGRFPNKIYEVTEDATFNVIGEIIEIQGKLVFTYTNQLYTYDLSTGQFETFVDLYQKRNINNPDAAWDWGFMFSSGVTKKDDNTYYYSTQGSGEKIIETHGGTILKLDVSSSPWVISHEYTIDVFTADSQRKTEIQLRTKFTGGPGIKGSMLLLPGANSDPDTLVAASEYNSPSTMGCIFAYPLGDNTNRISVNHIIKEFPESGFDPNVNSSSNDSTAGWFPMSDLGYDNNKIYGFTKGGPVGFYNSNDDHGKERGTASFNGTFWSIDRANSDAFSLLYTLEENTGIRPLQTSTDIIQLKPLTGKKLNADTIGCSISTRTFKVSDNKRGTLQWWSSDPNVTLVPGMTNADSATFDFSGITSSTEKTTTISVAAVNMNASANYQYGDTISWNVHQFVLPSIGNIETSVDLHCPTQHAKLNLSNYAHIDSFAWDLPSDITLLDADSNKDNIQIDLSNEQYGTHQIICHGFNGCGDQVSDTLVFNLVDPNLAPSIVGSSKSVCLVDTLTLTASTVYQGQKVEWSIPQTAAILNTNAQDSSVVQVVFGNTQTGSYTITAKGKSNCGQSNAGTYVVDIVETPIISSITPNKVLDCTDDEVSIVVDAIGGTGFTWTYPDDAVVVSGQNTKFITLNVEDVEADSMTVAIQISSSCSSNVSDSIVIALAQTPQIGDIEGAEDEISISDTVTLRAIDVTGVTTYLWELPQEATPISPLNEATVVFTVQELDIGDHEVHVIGTGPCGTAERTTSTIRIEYDVAALKKFDSDAFVLYPNPSDGRVSIQNKKNEYVYISVKDNLGKVIKVIEGSIQEVDLSDLPNGKYYLDISSKNKNYGHYPLIIQK